MDIGDLMSVADFLTGLSRAIDAQAFDLGRGVIQVCPVVVATPFWDD